MKKYVSDPPDREAHPSVWHSHPGCSGIPTSEVDDEFLVQIGVTDKCKICDRRDQVVVSIRCPWCASEAPVRRNRISFHKAGPQKCVGVGQHVKDAQELNDVVFSRLWKRGDK